MVLSIRVLTPHRICGVIFFVKLKGETMVSKITSSITEINQKGVYSGFIGRRLYGTIRYNKAKELLRFGTLQAPIDNAKDVGIIVLPTTELTATELANWLKQNKIVDLTIGNYFNGKYKSDIGVSFNETSLCVQINNITSIRLKDIAMQMRKDFRQESVLIKDNSTGKIWR